MNNWTNEKCHMPDNVHCPVIKQISFLFSSRYELLLKSCSHLYNILISTGFLFVPWIIFALKLICSICNTFHASDTVCTSTIVYFCFAVSITNLSVEYNLPTITWKAKKTRKRKITKHFRNIYPCRKVLHEHDSADTKSRNPIKTHLTFNYF